MHLSFLSLLLAGSLSAAVALGARVRPAPAHAAVSSRAALSPPLWGAPVPVYSVNVNMTCPDPVTTWQFDYYFNATSTASRYEHHPPQFDEMCAGQPYDEKQECHVLFATDGWSYILYPLVQPAPFCCRCGSEFGSTRWDWLKENSTFIGVEQLQGRSVQHWTEEGQVLNHYYATLPDDKKTGASIGIRFAELWGEPPQPKVWDFNVPSYRFGEAAFDPAKLQVPAGCDKNMCQSDICQGLRLQADSKVALQ
jgi:hypothetical protein